MRIVVVVVVALTIAPPAGCRTAVVVTPRDPNTQTVVTVEQRPTTSPADKRLIVRDRS